VVVLAGGGSSVELAGQVLSKGLPLMMKHDQHQNRDKKSETRFLSLFMFDAQKMKP
jgi:hypothetical protein